MALLPKALRFSLFDALSLKTMRFVHAVPRRQASGLVAEVYEQIDHDFFSFFSSICQIIEMFVAILLAEVTAQDLQRRRTGARE